MKVLFVTHQSPWPHDSGQKLRNYYNLKCLCQNHTVDIISTDKSHPEQMNFPIRKHIHVNYTEPSKLLSIYAQFIVKISFFEFRFKSQKVHDYIKNNHQDYDLIWFAGLQHMTNIPNNQIIHSKIILDNHNIECKLYGDYAKREKNPLKRILLKNESLLLEKAEKKSWATAYINFACSKNDTDVISNINSQTHQLPNSMEDNNNPKYFPNLNPFKLIYCGTMNWLPNVDAMEYFMTEIWPEIYMLPNIEFHLIGGGLPEHIAKLFDQYENCTYHGYVKDIEPLYRQASLSVVPLRMGSGTRLKILEAASWALPTVSTKIGASGLEEFYGHGVHITKDTKSFIDTIINLSKNHEELIIDSKKILTLFKNHFSVESNEKIINKTFTAVF